MIAAPLQSGWTELRGRTVLRLSGSDRVRYLNGQVTIDIPRLVPGCARRACVLTAKGKLCAVVFIAAEPDSFRIDAESGLREELLARVERYLVADDAAVLDVSNDTALFHWIGPIPGGAVPPGAACCEANRFGWTGTDLVVPAAEADKVRDALQAFGSAVQESELERIRIERGIPTWGAELGPDTLPPEARLDEIAIDYDKGCYLGQETISRLRSVGHVNRSLRHLVAASATLPVAGSELKGPNGEPAGRVTSAVFSFALDRGLGLGYVRRPFWDPGTLLSATLPEPGGFVEVEVRLPPRL